MPKKKKAEKENKLVAKVEKDMAKPRESKSVRKGEQVKQAAARRAREAT
jgi:hypothetical protein